jgi:large conductance mechanosensitive channel
MSVASEFREFVLRGNVVDLAVGVVIGAAFTGVVNSFVKGILTPLISLPGTVNFSDWVVQVGGARFMVGDFVNAIVSFLIVSLTVFFLVVKPLNVLMTRLKPQIPPQVTTRDCPFCLSSIPQKATRCSFCTSEVQPV